MKAILTRARLSASGFLAVLAGLFLLTSCWHPAFDPDISGSEAVIRRLGAPVLYFTAENVEGWEMEDAWFLPNSSALPTAGLLMQRTEDSVRLKPTGFDAALHTGTVDSIHTKNYINVFESLYTAVAAPNGNTEVFLAVEPTLGRYISPMSPPTELSVPLPPSAVATYGLGFVNSPLSQASYIWIGYQSSSLPGFCTGAWTGGGSPGFGPSTDLVFSDSAYVSKPGKAFLTSAGYTYLSCGLQDGTRAIYRWLNPTIEEPSRYPEVYGPLIGALSDGRLLAEKDSILSVLDQDLKRQFSFPAGSLRFVQERWDGLDMLSVFTRTIYVRTASGDDRGRLKVEVYEIPSADLYKLAD